MSFSKADERLTALNQRIGAAKRHIPANLANLDANAATTARPVQQLLFFVLLPKSSDSTDFPAANVRGSVRLTPNEKLDIDSVQEFNYAAPACVCPSTIQPSAS